MVKHTLTAAAVTIACLLALTNLGPARAATG